MSGFLCVAVWGLVIISGDRTRGWHERHIAKIPVPLTRMNKPIDQAVLILVARTASELGNRAELNHGIGQGRSGKDLGAPYPACRLIARIRGIG